MSDKLNRGASIELIHGCTVTPLGPEDNRTWTVRIDGKPVEAGLVEIVNERFGTLVFGKRPEGFDGWLFRQTNGGGVITIPYAFIGHQASVETLHVGLIEEYRPNMGGLVLCAIGGFVEPTETTNEAQERELKEEAGVEFGQPQRVTSVGMNPNRAFFVGTADEGDMVYALPTPTRHLYQNERGQWRIREGRLNAKREADIVFLHWRDVALEVSDALAKAATLSLIANLAR